MFNFWTVCFFVLGEGMGNITSQILNDKQCLSVGHFTRHVAQFFDSINREGALFL